MKVRATPGLIGLVALTASAQVEAKTYRWVNDQGIVTYSDQPPQVRPVEGERESLITEALDISGTKKTLEAIPAHGAFRTNYDPSRMGFVIAQLRTPLFRKVAALEVAASEPGAKEDLERFTMGLQGDPPKPARVALVQRHEAAVRSAELQIEMGVVAFKAVTRSLEPVLPSEKRPTARETDTAERTLRAQQDNLIRAALVRWLYTFRSLTDEELGEYVAFGESDPGRWFVATQRKGLLDAMRTAMDAAARQMAAAFPAKR